MKILHIGLFGSMLLTGCSLADVKNPRGDEKVPTPSEINAEPQRFHEQHVKVKGFVLLSSNSHNLYESAELHEEFESRLSSDPSFRREQRAEYHKYCLTIANPEKLQRNPDLYRHKTLVFRGIFVKDYLKEGVVDLGACRLPGAIVID